MISLRTFFFILCFYCQVCGKYSKNNFDITLVMPLVTCHMSCFFWKKLWSQSVEGVLSTGPTPSSLSTEAIIQSLFFSSYYCQLNKVYGIVWDFYNKNSKLLLFHIMNIYNKAKKVVCLYSIILQTLIFWDI